MFEWGDLRFVLAIDREGTLSAAARSLGVAQTTVGRRLEAIEGALGTKLFLRTKAGLSSTELGREVVALAAEVERAAVAVERRAQGHEQRVEGRVRIATTEAFARDHLVPRLAEIHRLHPGLELEVVTGNHRLDLDGREADLAVRLMRPDAPSLVARKIGEIELRLYASAGYLEHHGMPVLDGELRGHRVLGYLEPMTGSPEARWLAEHARAASVPLRTASIPALRAAVAEGMGLAILPSFLADDPPPLRLVAMLGDLAPRPVWVVFHADLRDDARVRAVVEHLAAFGLTGPSSPPPASM